MFDLLGWSWTYEPPVEAFYYIPDFAISVGIRGSGLLAECKPAISLKHKSFTEAAVKAERSGLLEEHDFLLLGAQLFEDDRGGVDGDVVRVDRRDIVGLLSEHNSEDEDAHVFLPCYLIRAGGVWLPTVDVEKESDHPEIARAWLKYAWRESGNRVQYKSGGRIR